MSDTIEQSTRIPAVQRTEARHSRKPVDVRIAAREWEAKLARVQDTISSMEADKLVQDSVESSQEGVERRLKHV